MIAANETVLIGASIVMVCLGLAMYVWTIIFVIKDLNSPHVEVDGATPKPINDNGLVDLIPDNASFAFNPIKS